MLRFRGALTRCRVWGAVPVIRDVRVGIDQARNTGEAAEIDQLRSCRNLAICGDTSDLVAIDDDNGVFDSFVAIPELAELDSFHRSHGIASHAEHHDDQKQLMTEYDLPPGCNWLLR